MNYDLIITQRAQLMLDRLVDYLMFEIESIQAATHLLDEIAIVYQRLKENPFQFPRSKDWYLHQKQYREVVVSNMNYIVIFKVEKNTVSVLGIFHQLEQYEVKL